LACFSLKEEDGFQLRLKGKRNNMKIKSQFNLYVDLILFIILIPIFIARGSAHEVFGYLFGLFTLTHLILHWKQIYALIKIYIPVPRIRQVIVSVFCVFCIVISIWSINQGGKRHNEKRSPNSINSGYERKDI
jgi:hypothetical protein